MDVLLPVYNAEATVEQSIASILNQTVADIRLVVVDDGSTDASGAIIARMAEADPRIVIVTRENGGVVEALNTGLAACTAPYVARHDADDIAFPDRFARQLQHLAAHPQCVAVGANAWHIDAEGRRLGTRTQFDRAAPADPFWYPSHEPYLLHPFLMVRREALVRIGGYRHVFHAQDVDLYWRLMEIGELFKMPEVLGEYRIHGASISNASIINGRVSALHSQLAALSRRRRLAGQADIVFTQAHLDRYQRAGTLAKIIEIASEGLSPTEVSYLRASVAAKLLSLSLHRTFRLEVSDCRYVKAMLRTVDLSPANRSSVENLRNRVGFRLLRAGRFDLLLALAEGRTFLSLAARLVRSLVSRPARLAEAPAAT